jgi:hypothetical protein
MPNKAYKPTHSDRIKRLEREIKELRRQLAANNLHSK